MLDLDAIFRTKREKPSLPRTEPDPGIGPDDLPGDWRVEWEERAAIMEYDGGLPRERAEALALGEIIKAMERAAVSLIK